MYGIGLVVYFLATSIAQTASTPLHSRRNEFYYQNACNLMNTRQVDSRSVESIRRNEAEDVTQILVLAWILSIITNRILQNKVWQTNSFLNLSLQNTLLQSFKAIVQRILSSTKAHARHTHCDGEAKARFTISFFLVLSSVLWSTPLPRGLLSSTLHGFIRPSICTRCTFGTHFQMLDPHVLVSAFRRNVAQA
jgi:hypothetical protein